MPTNLFLFFFLFESCKAFSHYNSQFKKISGGEREKKCAHTHKRAHSCQAKWMYYCYANMSLSRCGDYSHFSATAVADAADAAANFTLIATIPFFFFVLFTLLFRLHCCFIFIHKHKHTYTNINEILLYLCLRFIFSSDVYVCFLVACHHRRHRMQSASTHFECE